MSEQEDIKPKQPSPETLKETQPQPVAQAISSVKRSKKAVRKAIEQISEPVDRYQGIDGVSDWFQVKKKELEAQIGRKSIYQALPLNSHTWRPPRVDQERCHVDRLPSREDQAVKDATVEQLPKKRVRRSNSSDALMDTSKQKRHHLEKDDHITISNPVSGRWADNLLSLADQVAERLASKNLPTVNELQYDLTSPQFEDHLGDYLELADFMMRETVTQSAGLWLKGSLTCYQERAVQILHLYQYNFDLAKFHILFPRVMACPQNRRELLLSLQSPQELTSLVTDAIIDLRGCKTQEADEALSGLNAALKDRITLEELSYHTQILKKLRVNLPEDVDLELQRSREFSKAIKKRCGSYATGAGQVERKLKMAELLELQTTALEQHFIITPEMQALGDYLSRAQAWLERASAMSTQVVSLKSLQTTLQESKAIPVNFEEVYDVIRKRSAEGQALVDRIYSNFTKVTKTRIQVQTSTSDPQPAESAKEQHFRQMLREAEDLKITHPEVTKLREHLMEVDEWKARVHLLLEDSHEYQQHNREVFVQLLKETALFKVELDLAFDLQKRLEFIEWHIKAVALEQIISNNEGELVAVERLFGIMEEARAKGFDQLLLPEIQRLNMFNEKAVRVRVAIQNSLDAIESGKKPYQTLSHLHEIKAEVMTLRLEIESTKNLSAEILKAEACVQRCIILTDQATVALPSFEEEGAEEALSFLKDLLAFYKELSDLCIEHETFHRFRQLIGKVLSWIDKSRLLIKSYHKSLDLQSSFAQLGLLEPQSHNEEIGSGASDFEALKIAIKYVEEKTQILRHTKDYKILKQLYSKVIGWLEQADAAMEGEDTVEQLEKLQSESLPLPAGRSQQVSKMLRRARWLRRFSELKNADRVKLKQIEALVRDSAHGDIQESCSEKIEWLQEQLQSCRIWDQKHSQADPQNQQAIIELLELGRQTLKFKLGDFVDLGLFHDDSLKWKEATKQLLSGHKFQEMNIEYLRKHLEAAASLDVRSPEKTLLQSLLELATAWKDLARKALSTRLLPKIEAQASQSEEFRILLHRPNNDPYFHLEEITTPYDLPQAQDEIKIQKYCICRKQEEFSAFMICCDNCEEWFHGPCVGHSEESFQQNTQQQYTCIGCALIYQGFDLEEEDGGMLKGFFEIKRVDLEIWRRLILEGLSIPLYLEELQDMRRVHYLVQDWLKRAEASLAIPLTVTVFQDDPECLNPQAPDFESSSESSDIIINTRSVQKPQELDKIVDPIFFDDQVGRYQMNLLLEIQGLPVDIPTEKLLNHLRIRKWIVDSKKALASLQALNEQSSSGVKAGVRKALKEQVEKWEGLAEVESKADLQTVAVLLLRLNAGLEAIKANGPYQQHQLALLGDACYKIVSGTCRQSQRIPIDDVLAMMRDLEEEKTEQIGIVEESLRNYTEWETRADEMRTKVATLKQEDAPRETQEQALEAYLELLREAKTQFRWLESPSLDEKVDEMKAFEQWQTRADYILTNFNENFESHPNHVKEAVHLAVEELIDTYQQLPFFSIIMEYLPRFQQTPLQAQGQEMVCIEIPENIPKND